MSTEEEQELWREISLTSMQIKKLMDKKAILKRKVEMMQRKGAKRFHSKDSIGVRLSEEQRQKIDELILSGKISLSNFIRTAIDKLLEEQGKNEKAEL